MRRHFVLLAVMGAGVLACGRTAAPATNAPATAPAAAPTQAAGHQHGQPAVAEVSMAAAVTAEPMHADSGDERVSHNHAFRISADSLAAQLGRGGTVVIHVGRTDSAYLAGHVPGARYLPLSAVATTVNGVPNEFPPLETMANAFSALVIRPEDRIVLYGDDVGQYAARAWVALDLMGQAHRAAILDGGLTVWRAGGRQVETGPVALIQMYIPFTVDPQPQRLVDAAWVRAHLGDSTVLFVDVRPAEQYAGVERPCPSSQPTCAQTPEARRGHIPGARNVPWLGALVSSQEPMLKPMHQLHHMVWQPAGADAAHVRTVVVYCNSGMQASHGYFVARYVGYRDVRMYDGGMAEWSRLPAEQYPVSRETAGAPHEHQH
jgi:thiosulfate/3-mercaptopyruvate sulfurtransferase